MIITVIIPDPDVDGCKAVHEQIAAALTEIGIDTFQMSSLQTPAQHAEQPATA